jgi:hypothetical protein
MGIATCSKLHVSKFTLLLRPSSKPHALLKARNSLGASRRRSLARLTTLVDWKLSSEALPPHSLAWNIRLRRHWTPQWRCRLVSGGGDSVRMIPAWRRHMSGAIAGIRGADGLALPGRRVLIPHPGMQWQNSALPRCHSLTTRHAKRSLKTPVPPIEGPGTGTTCLGNSSPISLLRISFALHHTQQRGTGRITATKQPLIDGIKQLGAEQAWAATGSHPGRAIKARRSEPSDEAPNPHRPAA